MEGLGPSAAMTDDDNSSAGRGPWPAIPPGHAPSAPLLQRDRPPTADGWDVRGHPPRPAQTAAVDSHAAHLAGGGELGGAGLPPHDAVARRAAACNTSRIGNGKGRPWTAPPDTSHGRASDGGLQATGPPPPSHVAQQRRTRSVPGASRTLRCSPSPKYLEPRGGRPSPKRGKVEDHIIQLKPAEAKEV
ncbi:UNVERIFIED_CONTAM: hypothetical protein K2H54_004660 [Gekko kuhli]